MKNDDQARLREYAETWERAGAALKEIKRRELRKHDDGANFRLMDEMLDWACKHAKPRLSSGLVEQQRVFMKLRKKEAVR